MFKFPDWFSSRPWATIKMLLGEPKNILEIGVFEGRHTKWCIDNFDCTVTCVDPYISYPDYTPNMEEVLASFLENIPEDRVVLYHDKFYKVYPILYNAINVLGTDDPFDYIYVDGDHTTCACLHDFVGSINLSRTGTKILIDDTERLEIQTAIKAVENTFKLKKIWDSSRRQGSQVLYEVL